MIRILVVDDHPVVRAGIIQILSQNPSMHISGEASDDVEAMDALRAGSYDVVLMDISMPGRGGLDALRQIRHEFPRLPVLILSVHEEDQYALRALRSGASGYLTKATLGEELLTAVQKVARGQSYISARVAERIAQDIRGGDDDDRPPHEKLSDREYEVLRAIGSGRTVSQIAEELALSVKTISTYRTRLLEKLGLTNNAELMRYAIDQHLVE